jgi:glutaminyl-tRNA synthetase
MADVTNTGVPPTEEKGPSKRALEKLAKKAAAKAKKAEYALRPKEKAADAPAQASTEPAKAPASVFSTGWLQKVYNEKPVKEVRTRFP